MGPAATIDFLAKLVEATPAQRDADHLRVIVDCDPSIPDRTAAILGSGPSPGPRLAAMARELEARGAGVIVMPCNTAHAFADEVRQAIRVPFIDMVEAAVAALPDSGGRHFGLLATSGTVASGIYEASLRRRGGSCVLPNPTDQTTLMAMISSIKASASEFADGDQIAAIANHLIAAGASAIIVGCTELSIAIDTAPVAVPIVDASRALAVAVVRTALGDGDWQAVSAH
jgi:aspartate racemase